MKKSIKAFTIVELVIVIAVIAILAAVLIPTFGGVIKNANKSADESEAASLNTQLAITNINGEEDLYALISEVYGEKTAKSFAPRSAKYGYHYWYDVQNNRIILSTYDGLPEVQVQPEATAAADESSPTLCAAALAEEETEITFKDIYKDSFRMFNENYYILDRGGSVIGEALEALSDGKDIAKKLNALKAVKNSDKDLKAMADAILERLPAVAIVSDEMTFVYDADSVKALYFVPGIETISSNISSVDENKKPYIAKAENVQSVNIPSTVKKVEEGALMFDTAGAVTLNWTSSTPIATAFKARATNAIIAVNETTTYSIDDNKLMQDGNVVDILDYMNHVTDFEILANESYADVIAAHEAVYVPYEKGSVTLYASGINANASSKDMTWQVVDIADTDQDGSLITVDQEGKVTFVKMPKNGIYTATVRATAVAGGLTRDIKIRLVVVTDMTVTVNNELVDLSMNTPYVELSYTGESDSFNFVVGDFSTNYSGYPCDTTVAYEYDSDIFEIADGKLTLKKDGQGNITEGERKVTIKVGPADDPYLEETITVEVVDNSSEPFIPAFEYINDFTYRVGNVNTITLGTLFTCEKIPTDGFTVKIKNKSGGNNGVYPELPAASGTTFGATYTYDSTDWTKSTIKFSGVGIAVIEIDGVELLTLEVVNGTNYFEGNTLPTSASTHIILLGNTKITSTLSLSNKCLFGNGFVIDATGASNTAIGIITLNNGAMLDNAIVIGAVYTTFEGNSGNGQIWSTSLVYSLNGSIISNSYLANTKAPVRVGAGTTTITNSTISGGCYANIDVRSGSELILENATLINQVGGKTPTNKALGLGVAIHQNDAEAKVVIKGTLKQYNAVSVDNDKNYLPNGASDVQSYINEIKSIDSYTVNGKTYNDTGIISLSDEVGNFIDVTEADVSVTNTHVNKDVASGRYLYHISTAAGPALYDGTYSYDNTWEENGYVPNAQGDIPPTYSTVLTTTKQGNDTYCYLDKSTIKIGYESGGKQLTFSSEVFNITDSLGNKLDLKSITINGVEVSDTYTFNKAGDYTLKVTVEANGKTYTYTLSVNVTITSYAKGSVTLGSNTVTITGSSSKDYYVVFDILANVTITDVDENNMTRTAVIKNGTVTITENGVTRTATLSSDGDWKIALDDTGYIVTITTDWKNHSGDYTTLKIQASTSGAGDPQNWTLTCDGNKGCPANSLHSCKEKRKNNAVTPTATFVYYGFNGEASNGDTAVKLKGSTTMGSAKHTVSSCVTGDTLVTLADGSTKLIKELTYQDSILVWNHFTGEFEASSAAYIVHHGDSNYRILNLQFSDGESVEMIAEHGFFDMNLNRYVYITEQNVESYIGHKFAKYVDGKVESITLDSFDIYEKYTGSYSIASVAHNNVMANGYFSLTTVAEIDNEEEFFNFLTMGENMMYDEAKLQEDIAQYGLFTYEDLADYMSYDEFLAFEYSNGCYLKIAVEKGYISMEALLSMLTPKDLVQ